MDDLLAKAMQGVDPADPGAFFVIFTNLMRLVPWGQLILWQVVFIVVGAVLGGWRGRLGATLVATLIFGPFGWIVPFLPRRPAGPPPLPGSKKR
ncbi:hypothetical protein L2Y94_08210 [Luteibacter aegosomatis]|uniref:hypothetical protein n=1 Tax=Luteibacter aegosomatis TaxID=2911537 RepID=UPI001FFA71F7|nr:hypothetical protein [Luteibacter aegosomatis]UPG87323.1 hypothetical protein L2Y94_08210 [Luteibacter aegosomatis]